LPSAAKQAIENPDALKFVSIASVWEMAIKVSIGKLKFENGFKNFLELIEENGFQILPISTEHALSLATLEFIHRDPFDRLLIAQAKVENLTIITSDENIKQYSVSVLN